MKTKVVALKFEPHLKNYWNEVINIERVDFTRHLLIEHIPNNDRIDIKYFPISNDEVMDGLKNNCYLIINLDIQPSGTFLDKLKEIDSIYIHESDKESFRDKYAIYTNHITSENKIKYHHNEPIFETIKSSLFFSKKKSAGEYLHNSINKISQLKWSIPDEYELLFTLSNDEKLNLDHVGELISKAKEKAVNDTQEGGQEEKNKIVKEIQRRETAFNNIKESWVELNNKIKELKEKIKIWDGD